MKTSREHVLEYIRAHRAVSAAELSHALQMTEANARHHLNILLAQGLVVVIGNRRGQGKGRPVRLFALSELVIGSQMQNLAEALLVVFFEKGEAEAGEQKLKKLARRLVEQNDKGLPSSAQPAGSAPVSSSNLTQRLVQAVQRMNELHYEARWEAHSLAPRFILGRCPYATIIDEHTELCQMDRLIIEHLLGCSAEQIARRQPDRQGLRQCIFALNRNARHSQTLEPGGTPDDSHQQQSA